MAQAYVEKRKVVITGGDPFSIDITGNSKVGVVTNGTWNGSSVGVSFGGTGANNSADARVNLGLELGVDVQSFNATLNTVANGTYAGDDSIVTVGNVTTGTWEANVVGVAYGGTGANTLTGYVKADGTNAFTASSTIPAEDVEGFSNSVSNLVSTSLEVSSELDLTYDSANDTVTISISDAELLSVANGTYAGDDSIVTVGTISTGTWEATDVAVAHGGTGASDAANARVNLGVEIGVDVQAYDAELAALAGVTSAADALPYFTGSGTADVTTLTSFGRSLLDDADASEMISTLGLGTMSTQDANNVAITGGTITANSVTVSGNLVVNGTTTTINSTELSVDDKNVTLGATETPTDNTADGGGITLKGDSDKTFNWVNSTDSWTSSENMDLASGKVYSINGTNVLSSNTLGSGVVNSSLTSVGTISTGTWEATDVAVAHGGTGASDAANARINLGVEIGVDVQAYDAELAALAGVTSAANTLPYFTGSGSADVTTLTSFARTLLDDADASAMRTTLGLDGLSLDFSNVTITGGTITGISELSIEGSFNSGVTLEANTYSNAKVSIRSPIVDLKSTGENSLFTVPTGYMFLIDSMEVLTTSISGAAAAPQIRFGNTGDSGSYYSASTSLSNSLGARHIIDIPQDAAVANTVVTFGVTTGSTATSHEGVGIVTGYLVKLS